MCLNCSFDKEILRISRACRCHFTTYGYHLLNLYRNQMVRDGLRRGHWWNIYLLLPHWATLDRL